MSPATRTLNPLHFEDLEPHRFEDLVRQLVYDFRDWSSLEAVGRSGSDEGMDIRGTERILLAEPHVEEDLSPDQEETEGPSTTGATRTWIIQCKREGHLGPKRLRGIVSSNLSSLSEKPYGYIVAAPCDFSLSSRNAFKDEARTLGIQEFYLWGKGEIEDQLVLPKNDHLLFAYFGISLQIQRRSARTLARARIALKRKLVKTLGELTQPHFVAVLIRDPRDEDYPAIKDHSSFISRPRWRYWWFHSHQPPDHLAFVSRKQYGFVVWDRSEWDLIDGYDAGIRGHPQLHGIPRDSWDPTDKGDIYNAYWSRNVPEANRAWALELRIIHYDRILAIDELGDTYNEGPHLLVDFRDPFDPFEPDTYYLIESAETMFKRTLRPREGTRITHFPEVIPDERELYQNELRQRLSSRADG